MNPKVDWFFIKAKKWQEELVHLREVILSTGLEEQLKWGVPCYTLQLQEEKKERNVVLIHAFKDYCAVLFFKGSLLEDPKGVLIQQTANVQAARQMRFTSVEQLVKQRSLLKKHILDSIKNEKAGLKVALKETTAFEMPDEFKLALKESAELRAAFKSLTPGRQRGYLLHFSTAKQSATRVARIQKCTDKILKGKGLDD